MLRYQLTNWIFGFKHVQKGLARQQTARRQAHPQSVECVCEAVNLAARFYFKPVRCQQSSAVTVRLLRKCGIDSRMVIGYRQSPFFFACLGRDRWLKVLSVMIFKRIDADHAFVICKALGCGLDSTMF
jgi:hypothetical protein